MQIVTVALQACCSICVMRGDSKPIGVNTIFRFI
jgi:hypothetical protein